MFLVKINLAYGTKYNFQILFHKQFINKYKIKNDNYKQNEAILNYKQYYIIPASKLQPKIRFIITVRYS